MTNTFSHLFSIVQLEMLKPPSVLLGCDPAILPVFDRSLAGTLGGAIEAADGYHFSSRVAL